MKSLIKISIVIVAVVSFVSCKNDRVPNYQYMPNMYESVPYRTYGQYEAFANGREAQTPVEGTIPRGHSIYEYPDTAQGYLMAKENLKSPLDSTQVDMKKGEELFNIYCAICHGTKGNGKGKLVQREKILGVPAYDDAGRAITEGSIYHVIYYGKNAMGSYANQLNEKERWEVVAHVLELKKALEASAK